MSSVTSGIRRAFASAKAATDGSTRAFTVRCVEAQASSYNRADIDRILDAAIEARIMTKTAQWIRTRLETKMPISQSTLRMIVEQMVVTARVAMLKVERDL